MTAFAGNSLLCRAALAGTSIDAATFTTIRIASGAAMLWMLATVGGGAGALGGSWTSALALFAYAAGFSFAYLSLSAATGALLLFSAVQCTMIGWGLFQGERLNRTQTAALFVALGGVAALLLPGLAAPPLGGALSMLGAGAAWGVYSLRGRGVNHPLRETASNFLRALPFAAAMSVLWMREFRFDLRGVGYAVVSGALASGVGYVVWYAGLRGHTATSAATVQLSVPAVAALGGVWLLGEPITLRLGLASVAILGGVGVFLRYKSRTPPANSIRSQRS